MQKKQHTYGPVLGLMAIAAVIVAVVMFFATRGAIGSGQEERDYGILWSSLLIGGVGGLIVAIAFEVITGFYSIYFIKFKKRCFAGTALSRENKQEEVNRIIFAGNLEGEAGAPYREFLNDTLGQFTFEDSRKRDELLRLQKEKKEEASKNSKPYYFLWKCIVLGSFILAPVFAFCGTAYTVSMLTLGSVLKLGVLWLIPFFVAVLGYLLMIYKAYKCHWYEEKVKMEKEK